MKKKASKIISIILSLIMLTSLWPVSASAADVAAGIVDKNGNELGTYQYFSDALEAVQSITGKPTVILNKSVNMGGTVSVTQGDFILDLNGYTFTSSDLNTPFDIGSGVTVKIIDSGEDGKIISNYAVAIDNEGYLTLDDGTITGKGGVINRETGYFVVEMKGTVQSKGLPAIENSGEIDVWGNVISTNSYGVKNKGEDSFVSLEGYISGISAVYNVDGYCGLFGGEFVGTAGPAIIAEGGHVDFIAVQNVSGTDPDGLTETVDGQFTADIGENAVVTMGSGNVFPDGIVFYGRTIKECLDDSEEYYNDTFALFDENDNVISFANDATSVEGFVRIKQYRPVSVQKIGTSEINQYETLEKAVNRAVEYNTGSIITLQDDISLDAVIEIPSGIMTVDLNGHVLTSETGTVFDIGADADVTFRDSGENGKIESALTDEEGSLIPAIISQGTLTFNSGNFIGDIASYGDIVFDGGTFGETDLALNVNSTVTVNGGTFEHLDLVFDKEGTFSSSNIVFEGGTFVTGIATNRGSLDRFYGQTKRFFYEDGEVAFNQYYHYDIDEFDEYVTVDEFLAAQIIDANGRLVGYYSTVDAALKAAFSYTGSTVKVLADSYFYGGVYSDPGEVTLDLNGKTIKIDAGYYGIWLNNKDMIFNIKDSVGGGMILSDSTATSFCNFPYPLYVELAKEVNIYSGTIMRYYESGQYPSYMYAVCIDGPSSGNTGVVNIYGGRIAVESNKIYRNQYAIYCNERLNIYGGQIDSNSGTAIYVDGRAAVNVYGGSITSANGYAFYDGGSRDEINIYGGTISGNVTFSRAYDSYTLYGGYFPRGILIENRKADNVLYLNNLLAEGVNYYDTYSEKVDVADDQLSIAEYVEVREAFAARVMDGKTGETTHYKTFEEALAACQQEGSKTVLTLLEDVTLESTAVFTSGMITLDLNGKTILQPDDSSAIDVLENANVTVTDSIGTGQIIAVEVTDSAGAIYNTGSLTVENGKIQGAYTAVENYGALTVNGGEFVSADVSVRNITGDAKIYGGIFKADVVTDVYMLISGGIFECEKITVNDDWAEIKGGTFDIEKLVFGVDATASLAGGEFINGVTIESPDNFHSFYGFLDNYSFLRDENGEIISLDYDESSYDSYIKVSYGASLYDDAVIEVEEEYTYGDDITVKVFVGNIQLWENTHYTLTYTNDGSVGTQTLIIYGINGIEGAIVKDVTIVPREVEINWFIDDIYMEDVVIEFDGNSHTLTASFLNESWSTTDVEVANGVNTDAGTYTATVIFNDPNYVIKEGTEQVTYTITPKEVDIIWSEESSFEYDGNPHSVTAYYLDVNGERVDLQTENGTNTNAGSYTATAVLSDTNYVIKESTESFDYEIVGICVSFDKTEVNVSPENPTVQIVATVTPEDASNKSLVWESDNEAAATVDQNGLVTYVGKGTAVITATTIHGSSASCTVFASHVCGASTLELVEEKTATCLEDGRIEYYVCFCGKLYLDSEGTVQIAAEEAVIPAFNHPAESLVHTDPAEATCTEEGNTEYWTCTLCNKLFSDEECTVEISLEDTVIEAKGHDDRNTIEWTYDGENHYKVCSCGVVRINEQHDFVWITDSDPSCTSDGAKHEECTVCGYMRNENTVIEKLGHSLQMTEAIDANHTENGNIRYWTCSVCSKLYSDEEGTAEITLEDTIVDAVGHDDVSVVEWTKSEENHTKVCSCGEVLVSEEHGFEWITDEDATCTSDGTKHEECTVCGYTRNENTVIEKLGHSLWMTEEKGAACTESGNIRYWSCSVCSKLYSDEACTAEITLEDTLVEATGHSYESVVTPPTLDAYGYTTYTCTACGESYVDDYTDPLKPVEKTTLSGEITSYLSDTAQITVTLQKIGSEDEVCQILVQGNSAAYSFENVADGDYTLTVSKNNHVTRVYEATVSGEDVTVDVKIHVLGDINGDGKVNTVDVARANAHARGTKALEDYEKACADVNGDGKVNTVDVARINAHAKGATSLWKTA